MKKVNSRRTFIKKSALASLAIPILGSSIIACNSHTKESSKTASTNYKKLNILILGGTSYLGPHQVAYAIARGHSVSIFTRGKTKPALYKDAFKKVEHLIGDREDNLKALENRKWDVVIDNSGRKEKWTTNTANLLKGNVGQYIYTSSTGVYYPYLGDAISTKTPLVLEMPEGLTEDETYEHDYGIMKANSELAAIKIFGKENVSVIRPTYMLGPGDKTDRFIHWPLRLAIGGNVLLPGKKDDLVQYIDVRDVAEWSIRLAENKKAGTFNAVGPNEEQSILGFVEQAAKAFDKNSTFTLVNDYDFLKANNIYFQIPWVMPDEKHFGSARINNSNAVAAGLNFRPLQSTVKDVYKWWHSEAVDTERRHKYMTNKNTLLAKEETLLQAWNKSKAK